MRNFDYIFATLCLFGFLAPCLAERNSEPCQFFANGTKIRHPDDCSLGLTCIDFKSIITTKCTGTTRFYDKDKGTCVKALANDTSCAISCTNSIEKYLPDPKSCYGYYYCQTEDWPLYGQCPEGYHFNHTEQMCNYSYDSNCTISTLDLCAIVKNGVNFNDPSSCAKYYVCKNGQLSSASCKNMYFDPSQGKCIQKSLVQCKEHPYPANVCGTVKSPKANVFVKDGATCRGSFYCRSIANGVDLSPIWQKCPENLFFHEREQRCVNPLLVACTEDRCDGRTLNFVTSGKKGCRHYLRCSNGVKIEELSCGNKFFDETAGVCTSEILQYPACAK